MKIRNFWKYLPMVSLIGYTNSERFRRDGPTKRSIKGLGLTAYTVLAGMYLGGVITSGTPNVLRWPEITAKRKAEVQKYETLKSKAFQLADNDGIEGLSLRELDDLYTRAGVNPKIMGDEIVLPKLTTENLEKAVQNYELEQKKNK